MLQQGLWYCCSLRLAILHDAPHETIHRIIADGQPFADGTAMLAFGTEWRFLVALHLLRSDPTGPALQEARNHLSTMPLSE